MFNSTVRKCSATHLRVRVATGLLPTVLALCAAQLAYPQAPQVPTILQGQLLTSKGVPEIGNASPRQGSNRVAADRAGAMRGPIGLSPGAASSHHTARPTADL